MSLPNEEQSGIREPVPRDEARTLTGITRCVERLPVTFKRDLEPGDCVVVSTKNSVYRLQALGADRFHASGGWFDKTPESARTVTVNGCTFGGTAICTEIVAAAGLFLEFGNRVCTTRIRDVRVLRLPRADGNLPN